MANETTSTHKNYTAVGKKPRFRPARFVIVAVIILLGSFGAGLGGGYLAMTLGNYSNSNRTVAVDGNAVVSQEEEDISTVASKAGPSVVSIITSSKAQSYYGTTQDVAGAGTGIIISSDGYVLTNKHVVSNSSELSIMTSDGTSYDDVKVVGTDPLNDLAFLKVNGVSNLKPATLGDSSSVRIGQKVVAIGNSLGEYQNTVTSGIISATGRPVTAREGNSTETLTDLIQTDAAINPGNSGGPLTNLSGQVIGINTAVAQDAQGIGFAIPINSAKGIIKNLLKTGKVERPYIGVNYITITPDVAKEYKLSVKKGAYIYSDQDAEAVIAGSPAAKAGLKPKDIITKVGDIEVGERGSVASLVSEYSIGDKVQLTVIRDSKTMTVDVTLEAYTGN